MKKGSREIKISDHSQDFATIEGFSLKTELHIAIIMPTILWDDNCNVELSFQL